MATAVTLAESAKNTTDDLDLAVIDEFVKSDWFLSQVQFVDAVNPDGGGGTLTYGYTRLVTERPAQVRNYGAEVDSGAAVRQRFSVDLIPFGAAYTIDRDLSALGPAATNEVAFQTQQAIKSVRALFADSLIAGAHQTDTAAAGFDGLDAALAGSSTEVTTGVDMSSATVIDQGTANTALDALDNLLSLLDGEPTAILTNRLGKLRLRSLARRAGYYDRTKDDFGRMVESFGGVPFVDLGAKSGSNNPVIPLDTTSVVGQTLTDIYAVRLGQDGLHAVTTNGGQIVKNYLPDFTTAKAVKDGEVALGPVALALKKTKAAAVARKVRIA